MLGTLLQSLAAVACFMGPAGAEPQDAGSPWIETRFERVHLRNGNTIDGRVVRDNTRAVVLKLKSGEMEIRRDMIDRVETVRMRSLKEPPEILPARKAPTEAPPTAEKADPEQKPGPAVKPNFSAIPENARHAIDEVIHGWLAAGTGQRGDLAEKLEPLLSPDGLRYLCALLEEKPRRVPGEPLAAVIGAKADPSTVPSLIRALQFGPQLERRAILQALARIGTPEVVPPILAALEDGATAVSKSASEALVELNTKMPEARIPDSLISRIDATKAKIPYAVALGNIGGDDPYRTLIRLARSSDNDECLAGLVGLMKQFRPEDADLIMPLLQSNSPMIRKQTCVLLGRAKYKPAVKSLIDLLSDEDTALVTDAHSALQSITGQTLARDINLWKSWWEVAGSKE